MSARGLWLFITLLAGTRALDAGPALRVSYSNDVATLQWTAVSGASWYDVESTTAYPAWTLRQRVSSPNSVWNHTGLPAATTFIYRIVPRDASLNAVGTPSNAAIVSTHGHAGNPLASGNFIAAQHMVDLRTVMRSISLAAGAGEPVWTHSTLTLIRDEDVTDLRTVFVNAMTNVGGPSPSFVDGVAASLSVLRVQLQQLRDLARAFPERVPAAASVDNPAFSPNDDGSRDTTTFSATASLQPSPRTDFRWRLDVRNAGGAVVRSVHGVGTGISFLWDGRNGTGVVQPDGSYVLELVDLDSLTLPIAAVTARIDVTPPVAAISSPSDPHVHSNVHTGGNGNLVLTGTATDEAGLESWRTERAMGAGAYSAISSGTSPVSSASLGTWQTVPGSDSHPNGAYTIRLSVTDKAGNTTTDTVAVTLAHFSVTRAQAQARHGDGETVTYTSIVPFTMTERIEIRAGASVVRTLVDTTRTAGTYTDVWNGRNAQNQLVADGPYQYFAIATAGSSTFTWNQSAVFPGVSSTQYPYPKCRSGTAWVPCSDNATFDFDPFAGKPLRVAWCVGTGEPDSGCTGNAPALVVAKVSQDAETSGLCDYGCMIQEYLPGGRHELLWYGMSTSGTYVGAEPRMTVVRHFGEVPLNMTVLYGTAPVIHTLDISPTLFSPGSVGSPLAGQVFTLGISRFANRSVSVTAVIRNLFHSGILRTINVSPQAADVVTLVWDGRGDNLIRAGAGRYEVTITVTDENGSKATVRPIVVVRY